MVIDTVRPVPHAQITDSHHFQRQPPGRRLSGKSHHSVQCSYGLLLPAQLQQQVRFEGQRHQLILEACSVLQYGIVLPDTALGIERVLCDGLAVAHSAQQSHHIGMGRSRMTARKSPPQQQDKQECTGAEFHIAMTFRQFTFFS